VEIGNFGRMIIFRTSDEKILTFNDFKQTVTGRWATHDRIQKKPISEFLGPDNRKINFSIMLDVSLGVRPRTILESIEKLIEEGTVETLVIGGKKIGANRWKITSMSETWDVIMNKGELAKASAALTFEEYV